MAHMPISSCADIRQLYQYICLILTQCNQGHDHNHYYTYIHIIGICPWTICLPHCTYVSLYFYCNLHTDPTLLYLTCYIHICTSNKYVLKCHIYANYTAFQLHVYLKIPHPWSLTNLVGHKPIPPWGILSHFLGVIGQSNETSSHIHPLGGHWSALQDTYLPSPRGDWPI